MDFLRTASPRRLLIFAVALVAVVAAGTTLALAAGGSGPVPKPKPLAGAIRDALTSPPIQGVTADIKFTNHLIGSGSFEGSDPILTGASGRLWLTKDHLRLELQSDNGDAQVVANGKAFWAYDVRSHTVYRGTIPKAASHGAKDKPGDTTDAGPPTLAQIQAKLNELMQHANVAGPTPGNVGGQPAYTVSVSPKHDGGLLGSAELAWDAVRGMPLRFAIYAQGSTTPVIQLEATNVTYGPVDSSAFAVSPPPGAKTVDLSPPARAHGQDHPESQPHVAFSVAAPPTLAGLPRQAVRTIDWKGSSAVLVTYGRNLGAIAVIERSSDGHARSKPKGGHDGGGGFNLPQIAINGATGTELSTALGTVLSFDRGGVSYVVAGSVPAAAAEAAARGL